MISVRAVGCSLYCKHTLIWISPFQLMLSDLQFYHEDLAVLVGTRSYPFTANE